MKNTRNIIGNISLSATKYLYANLKKKIDKNITETLKEGNFILGKKNEELEQRLLNYLKVKHVLTVASGTDALTLSLKALDLKTEDEVIVPANVYPTAFGVALSGANIRLVDIDNNNLNLSLDALKKTITKKTKVIVAVHLYGNPVDVLSIRDFAKKRGIYLIEDCAQAIGAEYAGKKVGSLGDIATFSFYPTKNLAAFGDGGAISTNNTKLYKKIKLLRMYGEKSRYKSELVGFNSRFDEIQAGILLAQLNDLDFMNNKRRKNAAILKNQFKNLPIKILDEDNKAKNVYHLFVILTNKRDKLDEYLNDKGIETGIHYPTPIHLTKSFKYLGYKKGDFPVSEISSKQIISIPTHPFLEDEQIEYIYNSVKEFYS